MDLNCLLNLKASIVFSVQLKMFACENWFIWVLFLGLKLLFLFVFNSGAFIGHLDDLFEYSGDLKSGYVRILNGWDFVRF